MSGGDSECRRFGDIVSIGDGRWMMGGMRECFGHPFTSTLVLESNQFQIAFVFVSI
jgi:hypothetical protein